MPEQLTIRQQIWNAVKVRFQDIRTVNGYQTDIGANCFSWRDLAKSEFTEAELPAVTLRDPDCESENGQPVLTRQQHTLTVEAVAVASVFAGPPDNFARHILGDIQAALGVDRKWTVDGIALALDTFPGNDKLFVEHAGQRVAGCLVTFKIIFQTQRFAPYSI